MLDEKKPLVSICVLTYQHEKYIEQALDSFLSQETTFPFEIVIHDDASKDKTAEIIRRYAEQYPDIVKPLLQEKNQFSQGIFNVSGVYNYPRARGKYIAFCDGDDFWTDVHKLQRQVDYMEAHPECTLAIHAAMFVAEDGTPTGEMRPYSEDRTLTMEDVILARSQYPSSSMLFQTELAQSLPEFYYQAPVGDVPLHLAMAIKGTVYYDNTIMSVYRLGAPESWVTTLAKGNRLERQKKELSHNIAMRQMYERIDVHTDYQYHKAIAATLLRWEFKYHLPAEDYKSAMGKQYKEIRQSEYGFVDRCYILFRSLIPGKIYNGVRDRLAAMKGNK